MTVGSTECCGSTELGSGAFRAKRGRVGCGSIPDHGTTRTELEVGGGACVAVSWRGRRGRGTGEREAKTWPWPDPVYTTGGDLKRSGSSS